MATIFKRRYPHSTKESTFGRTTEQCQRFTIGTRSTTWQTDEWNVAVEFTHTTHAHAVRVERKSQCRPTFEDTMLGQWSDASLLSGVSMQDNSRKLSVDEDLIIHSILRLLDAQSTGSY